MTQNVAPLVQTNPSHKSTALVNSMFGPLTHTKTLKFSSTEKLSPNEQIPVAMTHPLIQLESLELPLNNTKASQDKLHAKQGMKTVPKAIHYTLEAAVESLPQESPSLDASFIHPNSPPIPAVHPNDIMRHDRQRTNSVASTQNSLVQNIPQQGHGQFVSKLPLYGTKSIKESKEQLDNACKKVYPIDAKKVLDPRARAKLELEPVHDTRLVNLLHVSSQPAKGFKPEISFKKLILNEPTLNSTRIIQKHMDTVQCQEFHPMNAMQQFIQQETDMVKTIKNKVTVKGINLKKNSSQYVDLPSLKLQSNALNEKSVGGLVTSHKRMIPRAKKSTSQQWLESLECKPEWDTFRQSRLEVDTICLPFPQLSDNPMMSIQGNPLISPSSLDINLEDSRRWILYDTPVHVDDI